MSEPLAKQIQYECDFFKHLTRYVADETTGMKNRIAEVLKEDFDRGMLDGIEYFQNECMKTDEIVGIIRNDITQLNGYLSDKEQLLNNRKQIQNVRSALSQKALTVEMRFQELQVEFNTFLFDNFEQHRR